MEKSSIFYPPSSILHPPSSILYPLSFYSAAKLPLQSPASSASAGGAPDAVGTPPHKSGGSRETGKPSAQINAPDCAASPAPMLASAPRFDPPQKLLDAMRMQFDAQATFHPPELPRRFPIGRSSEIACELVGRVIAHTFASAFRLPAKWRLAIALEVQNRFD